MTAAAQQRPCSSPTTRRSCATASSAALEGAGHRALTAKSAARAARARARRPDQLDLLVLDLRLNHALGGRGRAPLRKLDDGRLPILVFSGTVPNADEVRELAALGVAGYLNEYSAVQHILPSMAPHLFPDSFNRRASPRVVLGIPIAYRVGNAIAAALTLNLSRGGMAIRTTSPLEIDAKARLRFRLPGSKKDIDAEARVCWTDARIGMGLHFDRVEAADQKAIDEFVDAHFFQARRD